MWRKPSSVNDLDKLMTVVQRKQPVSGRFARTVAAEVRAAMARRYLSAAQLAELAGLSRSYIGKRLRNETPFTLNDIEAICAALGEEPTDFIQAAMRSNLPPNGGK